MEEEVKPPEEIKKPKAKRKPRIRAKSEESQPPFFKAVDAVANFFKSAYPVAMDLVGAYGFADKFIKKNIAGKKKKAATVQTKE